ncbi:hypothetical protein BpOF4_17110 [Alkalihalophilus pseudofirmus OF4]|uniref:GmrSD restriction endonucleases N-terminal domain-containing protein n=1 Tax=Alkalihalophilus pseudofirmus (strain ATCC BAA-2126 / JCM 17055 / OF4) TaxID=398511 RepID=D3FQU5_ALKPO|nr:DUF262 domain-containing protein [Alkalihalophilus pseudofirmus]ADC51465.1 hypothetical protein BpOF4_17110 [Alkalihalophilus pseudofirmus OF4]
MYQPEPQSMTFSTLISDIDKGIIKIPQFQRDFVWTINQSAKLIDSILKGYPIGTFILWESGEELRSIKNIGGAELPPTPLGSKAQYVLDGQQRMTSLYATLKGLLVQRETRKDNFAELYIDLVADEDDQLVVTDIEDRNPKEVISLRNLLEGDISVLIEYPKSYHSKLTDYKNRMNTYRFSTILLRDATIDVATEVFTRLNVGGKSLTVFEIMVAKTYDASKNFDLSEKYDDLLTRLEQVEYETIPESTVLQVVSTILVKECSRQHILRLEKADFIYVWDKAVDAIERAIEYFRNYYRIPVSRLLPYNGLVVTFAYFFYHHKNKPTGYMRELLDDFFWRVSLSERYSSALETRLGQDIKRIDVILKGELPKYDLKLNVTKDLIINNGHFSVNRSFIKSILCLMAYHEPKSFSDNSVVRINNSFLKQANSKNYHHFFPKAYLQKKGEDMFYINHIVNITIVDDFLNKNIIRAKAPSEYMKDFVEQNSKIRETMKDHLIGDLNEFGVLKDDYETFFEKRAELIAEELNKWLITSKSNLVETI